MLKLNSGYRHKPQFPGMSAQAALCGDERSGHANKKAPDPLEAKSCLEVSTIISRSSLYSAINSQNPARSQDIFPNEVVLLGRCVGVVLLCSCVWLLPFPPAWNLIRSRWEMEHKMNKQWCYLVRNACRNRGNPTFPYEDNFSNKTLSKHAGPTHKGSLAWARHKSLSSCEL